MPWGSPAFKFGNSSSHEAGQNPNESLSNNDRSRTSMGIHSNPPAYGSAPPSRPQQTQIQSRSSLPGLTSTTFSQLPTNYGSSSAGTLLTEDHEPNLANSRRLQGPPSVITTRPPRILPHPRLKRPPTSPSKHGLPRYKPNPYKTVGNKVYTPPMRGRGSPIKRGGSHKRIHPKQNSTILRANEVNEVGPTPPLNDSAIDKEMHSQMHIIAPEPTACRQDSLEVPLEQPTLSDSGSSLPEAHEHMDHSPGNNQVVISNSWKEEQDVIAPSEQCRETKEEPITYRPPSPIDVDAQPQTLYEQLGLPLRKSGAYRALHPGFKKSQQRERDKWAAETAEQIRWVRGKESGLKPLKVGRVLWRSDGVSFDWELPSDDEPEMQIDISPESLIPIQGSDLSFLTSPRTSLPDDMQRNSSPLPDNSSQYSTIHPAISYMESSMPANRTIHIKAEPVDEVPDLLSRFSPSVDSQTESTQPTDFRNPQESTPSHLESMRQENAVPTQETASWNTIPPTMPPILLSNVAICFLDRYTRCFDIPRMRSKLVDAYTEDALMSLQVVTNTILPQMDYALYSTHDGGVPPRMKSSLFIGAQSIAAQLLMFDKMTHTPSLSGLRSYEFDITPIGELNNVLLVYQGNFYSGDEDTGTPHVTSRFVRSFILTPNDPGIASWVDWPWIISNDQMTLFPLHGGPYPNA